MRSTGAEQPVVVMNAGLVRAPSAYAPNRNLERAQARAAHVLDAMVETGALSREQAEAARRQPAALRAPPETQPGTNYFVDMVNAEARPLLGAVSADWQIRSTLDLRLQAFAESVVAALLGRCKSVGKGSSVNTERDLGC